MLMADALKTIFAIALWLALAVALWYTASFSMQCNSDSGTVVRGLIWLECIK